MKRKFLGVVRNSIFVSSVLLLAACGGGNDSGGGPAPNADVGGLWAGAATISGEAAAMVGIVTEDGRGYFVAEMPDVVFWGTATSSGNQLTFALDGAGLLGWTFPDGSADGAGSISGTIKPRASISANLSFTTALGTKTTGAVSLDYVPDYDDNSSLALIAGNYTDTFWLMNGVFNIAGNGELFYQDPLDGCVINGKFAIIDPAYNAYDIEYSYSNCPAYPFFNGVTFRGLATYDADFEEVIVIANGLWGGEPSGQVFVLER
jgi:hypothetical protein